MELPLTRDTLTTRDSSARDGEGVRLDPRGWSPAIATSDSEAGARHDANEDAASPLVTHRRFDRAARLFSEPGLHRLMASRVLVIGVGGVGTFAAEALARSAVGGLTLIDFDRICVTNTNRQLHAMKGTIGKSKVEVMAERLRAVHPTGTIEAVGKFYNAASSDELLGGQVDFVVDAIDNITAKTHLIATCIRRGIPIVSVMGAAARLDPTQITVSDLSDTEKDPFASAVRRVLRTEHGVTALRGNPVGVAAVYSTEEPTAPSPISYDEGKGFQCVCPGGKNDLHGCEHRARIDGSAAFVTGAFGLTAASVVVRRLLAAAAS